MQFNYNNSTLISFKVPVDHVPVILLENRNDFVAEDAGNHKIYVKMFQKICGNFFLSLGLAG
jgi:hypothetical protein